MFYVIRDGKHHHPTSLCSVRCGLRLELLVTPEAITRLVLGVSGNLGQALINLQVKPEEVPAYVEAIKAQFSTQIVNGAMPIQDAIDLAEFLVDVTIKYVRFCPGSETVGGPIEVAAISKHEGFKWTKRTHYYSGALNL